MRPSAPNSPALERSLTLPALVLYGLGVTIGAGIFALIGEILDVAGDQAPLAFLLAGFLASFTAVSYMLLVGTYPRAGGEAVYVNQGIGPITARAVGIAVSATGIISSAVIALAFAGYVDSFLDVPERLTAAALVVALSFVAWWGVRESVILAGIVTLLEVGTLVIVIAYGFDLLGTPGLIADTFTPKFETATLSAVLSATVIAFFAFIGFEDIANMAEETVDPEKTAPKAIAIVLVGSVSLYVLLSLIAAAVPARSLITESSAPMAVLFEEVSGLNSKPVAAIASFAMINGILVQILVSARVLFGMASDNLLPAALAQVDRERQTPGFATVTVTIGILLLVLFFPLVGLARFTSLLTLAVFSLVNTSLFLIGRKHPGSAMARFRWVGVVGATLSFALFLWQIIDGLS